MLGVIAVRRFVGPMAPDQSGSCRRGEEQHVGFLRQRGPPRPEDNEKERRERQ